MVHGVSTIEYEGRLCHRSENLLVVITLEFIPLSQNQNSVSSVASVIWISASGDSGIKLWSVLVINSASIAHLTPHIIACDLRVVDMELGLLLKQVAEDEHGRSLSNITCVLLESISKHSDLLSCDSVEHFGNDLLRESLLLVVVHEDDLVPVSGTLIQSISFAQVYKIKNILLEARPSKTDGGIQEFTSDTSILSDRTANFADISSGGFTEGRNGIDRRNTLSKESVGDQLGKLRRPQVCCDDLFLRNPVGVNTDESGGSLETFWRLLSSNENTVWSHQILHGGSLCEELWVTQNLELCSLVVALQNTSNSLSGSNWDSTLLNDNLVRSGNLGNGTGT
mmetsp:Transcript_222/g.312  ORF Transcript_222/g.312 Transcript_222/m.312 type:complete len:339 (-) Transcript_222:385-1401(-)